MGFLGKFFKPKWQNENAEVRRQALLNLGPDESTQDIFIEIAKNDPQTDLRLLALKRLTSVPLVLEFADDPHREIKETAITIASQALAGQWPSLTPEKRLNLLDTVTQRRVLEHVARHGDASDIRKHAMQKVDKTALYIEVATHDNDPALRETALAHIEDKSALQRVMQTTKNTDKHIHSLAREKYETLVEKEELPKRNAAAITQIIQSIKNLGRRGDWQQDFQLFEKLCSQWQSLPLPPTDEDVAHFTDAANSFTEQHAAWQERNADLLKREARWNTLKTERESVLGNLQQLLEDLNETNHAVNVDDTANRFATVEAQWSHYEPIPEGIASDIETQYGLVRERVKERIRELRALAGALQQLADLQKIIDDSKNETYVLSEKQLRNIAKRRQNIKPLEHVSAYESAFLDIDNFIQQKQSALDAAKKKAKDQAAEINKKLAELDSALTDGNLETANRVNKSIVSRLDNLDTLDTKIAEHLRNDYNKRKNKLVELNKWRSWASTPKKEQLIAQVESLIGIQADFHAIAEKIKEAREQWKKLGPAEQHKETELWTRFDKACTAAYEPCREAFDKEAQFRQTNQAQREAFLDKLEQFLNTTDWETLELRQLEKLCNDSRAEWTSFGPTTRAAAKQLSSRFDSASQRMKNRIEAEWNENASAKRKLIDAATALTTETDANEAAESAKRLQTKWKGTGRASPKDEKRLWTQFREQMDKIFENKRAQASATKEALAAVAQEKIALLDKLAAIVAGPFEQLPGIRTEVMDLRNRWSEAGRAGKSDAELGKRFDKLWQQYENNLLAASKREQLREIRALDELNKSVSHLVAHVQNGEYEMAFSTADQIGNALQNIKTGVIKTTVQQFLDTLLKRTADVKEGVLDVESFLDAIEQEQNQLVLEMEIFSETPTPAAYSRDRMALQVRKLNEGFGQNKTSNKWEEFLQYETRWKLLPNKDSDVLGRRHKSINALKSKFTIELNDYV